jgi:hypothetical protein
VKAVGQGPNRVPALCFPQWMLPDSNNRRQTWRVSAFRRPSGMSDSAERRAFDHSGGRERHLRLQDRGASPLVITLRYRVHQQKDDAGLVRVRGEQRTGLSTGEGTAREWPRLVFGTAETAGATEGAGIPNVIVAPVAEPGKLCGQFGRMARSKRDWGALYAAQPVSPCLGRETLGRGWTGEDEQVGSLPGREGTWASEESASLLAVLSSSERKIRGNILAEPDRRLPRSRGTHLG